MKLALKYFFKKLFKIIKWILFIPFLIGLLIGWPLVILIKKKTNKGDDFRWFTLFVLLVL